MPTLTVSVLVYLALGLYCSSAQFSHPTSIMSSVGDEYVLNMLTESRPWSSSRTKSLDANSRIGSTRTALAGSCNSGCPLAAAIRTPESTNVSFKSWGLRHFPSALCYLSIEFLPGQQWFARCDNRLA